MKHFLNNKSNRRLFITFITISLISITSIIILRSNFQLKNNNSNKSTLPIDSNISSSPKQPDTNEVGSATNTPANNLEIKNEKISIKGKRLNYLLYSINFINAKYGWVIRYDTTNNLGYETTKLIFTHDGGKSWGKYEIKDALLKKIRFIDKDTGWAIAQKGNHLINDEELADYEILGTHDGGKNWSVQLKKKVTVSNSNDIKFQDSKNGTAIVCGVMYRTKDGGMNWSKESFPLKNFNAHRQSFIDKDTGWVIGTVTKINKKKDNIESSKCNVYVLCTYDGGVNWKIQYSKSVKDQYITGIDINFFNASTGWFFLSNFSTFNGGLYYTSNSGQDWKKISNIKSARPYPQELDFITPKIGWIPLNVGAGPISGGFLYTKDGGKTFDMISNDYGIYSIDSVDFVNEEKGWAAGSTVTNGDYIIRTTDGGKTWNQIYPNLVPTEDISFINNQTGYGLGMLTDQKALLKSDDKGVTWKYINSFPKSYIPEDISFVNKDIGWAFVINDTGEDHILKTLDGGNTWSEQNTNLKLVPYSNLLYFRFMNQNNGILITNSDNLIYYYRTSDGGQSWSMIHEKEETSARTCQFSFSSFDYKWKIITRNDKNTEVYNMKDGFNWEEINSFNQSLRAFGAEFITNEKGWILVQDQKDVTKNIYKLLRTEDGGKNWFSYEFPEILYLEPLNNQIPMQFIDDSHGWVLSKYGLLYTKNGGKAWIWTN